MRKGPRQGDVLLVPVDAVRGQKIRPIKQRYTVAEGEHTGHHHSFRASSQVAAFLGPDGQFIQTSSPMQHQEHDAVDTDGGAYEVVLQRRASEHRVFQVYD